MIGTIFVLTLVMGDFITVRFMSGSQSANVGRLISNDVGLLQYPSAAATSVVLLCTVLIIVAGLLRAGRHPEGAVMEQRPRSFYILAAFFGLYVLFLYGPTITIGILSFQGPGGGLTFPMRGVSLHWYDELFQQQAVGDIWGAWRRSIVLGLMVMVTTVVVSVMGGLAFRKRFAGSTVLFYLIITSLTIPSILISLGVGLIFSQVGLDVHWSTIGLRRATDLDAALRPADHVRGLQPVRQKL